MLDDGHSYETAARALDIPAGLAFMVATGLAADSSEGIEPPDAPSSPQQLVNPPSYQPDRKQYVLDWVRERARRELNARR